MLLGLINRCNGGWQPCAESNSVNTLDSCHECRWGLITEFCELLGFSMLFRFFGAAAIHPYIIYDVHICYHHSSLVLDSLRTVLRVLLGN